MPITAVLTDGPKSILGGFVGGYVAIVLTKRALGYTLSTGDYYAAALPLGLAIATLVALFFLPTSNTGIVVTVSTILGFGIALPASFAVAILRYDAGSAPSWTDSCRPVPA